MTAINATVRYQHYIGRPSVIKPVDRGEPSMLNSVKPSVRYVSSVTR